MRTFSYTPEVGFSEQLLLLSSAYGLLVMSFAYTPWELVLVRSFSYTPRTGVNGEYILHSSS